MEINKLFAFLFIATVYFVFFLIFKYFYLPILKAQRVDNSDLEYVKVDIDFNKKTKISKKSLFGIGKFVIDENEYYFDEKFFYELIKKEKKYYKIKHSSIIEISKTNFFVNNEFIWKIKFKENEKIREFKFLPSKKIINNGFIRFKKYLKKNNYNIKQTIFTLVGIGIK